MSSSWKIGAVSGLIAGLVAAIIGTVMLIVYLYAGLPLNPHSVNMPKFFTIFILHTMFWSMILGVVYSRAHEVISDKLISKAVLFGLFCGLVYNIFDAVFLLAYSFIDSFHAIRIVIMGLIVWIPFGLILASLYGRWYKGEKQKIITYDLKSGIHPGAIAGFICGILSYFLAVFYPYIGVYQPLYSGYLTDITFMLGQFGTHVLISMLWGTILGVLFAKAYNIIPKRGIVKGFYYGLILFFLSGVQLTMFFVVAGLVFNDPSHVMWGIMWFIFYMLVYPLYGVILGRLYRKPGD